MPLNLLLESKLKDKLIDCGGKNMNHEKTKSGSTEIWTRIAGFSVQSANRYTMEPRFPCRESNPGRVGESHES